MAQMMQGRLSGHHNCRVLDSEERSDSNLGRLFCLFFMKHKSKKKTDSFHWLERNSPKVTGWINDQQKKTDHYLSKCKNNSLLKKRFKKLLRVETMMLPHRTREYIYYRYRKNNEEQPSLYRQHGTKGHRELLINPNKLSGKDKSFIVDWMVSHNGKFILVAFSKADNDCYELRIFDIRVKKFLKDIIPSELYPNINAWNAESTGFWYSKGSKKVKGEEKFHKRIYFHNIGGPISKDQLVFGGSLHKHDYPSVQLSHDKKCLITTVVRIDWTTSVFYKDLKNIKHKFIEITKGLNAESFPYVNNGYIYLLTNHKAPNYKVLRRKISDNNLGPWETFIKENKHKLEGLHSVSGYIFLSYIENVVSKLYVIDLHNGKKKQIDLPGLGSMHYFSTDFDSGEIFFSYSSFSSPITFYRVLGNNPKLSFFWQQKLSADLNNIQVSQKWYKSKDGTKIPMFIINKKGLKIDGNNPALVYAYGGFNSSETPAFGGTTIPFIEDGGVFVVVNIRGGGEFGKKWHDAGKLKKKHKAFEDFADALKYLVKNKYSNSQKIAIHGGSNGGLLVSVIMLRYPELFKTAVIAVPVTDMLRYHLFNGGRWWIAEYGDPENSEMKKYLLKYSPYHNIKKENYPSALIVTSDKDDRVHPMHSYKFTAALQENKYQKNPILLRVERNAGHSGTSSMTPFIEKSADMYAFIYKQLGMEGV